MKFQTFIEIPSHDSMVGNMITTKNSHGCFSNGRRHHIIQFINHL